MDDFESMLIRETDTHEDFFGSSPVPLFQEQFVPQWGDDHPSQRSLIFGSSPSSTHVSTHLSSLPSANLSSSPSHHLSPPLSPHLPSSSPTLPSTLLYHSPSFTVPKPDRASSALGPNLSPIGPNLSTSPSNPLYLQQAETRISEVPRRIGDVTSTFRNSVEIRRADSQFRLEPVEPARAASPTKPELRHEASKSDIILERKTTPTDPLSHLHEKMATTIVKSEKFEKTNSERLLNYSDIPVLRNSESAPILQFKHPEDEGGSPWDDSFNSNLTMRGSKTRRETDAGKGR